MSPLLSSSTHHSNGNGGISNVVGNIGGGNVTSSTGIGRSAANAANAAAAAATAKMINPSAALQLSQTLAAMHSLRWVQCFQLWFKMVVKCCATFRNGKKFLKNEFDPQKLAIFTRNLNANIIWQHWVFKYGKVQQEFFKTCSKDNFSLDTAIVLLCQ